MKTNSKSRMLTKKVIGLPISLLTDIRYKPIVKKELKGKYGVYALYYIKTGNKETLYYVGHAHNLTILKRIKQHLKNKKKKKCTHFSIFFTRGKSYIKDIESIILQIIPYIEGNKQHSRLGRATKLKRRIEKEMANIDKERRTGIRFRLNKNSKKTRYKKAA